MTTEMQKESLEDIFHHFEGFENKEITGVKKLEEGWNEKYIISSDGREYTLSTINSEDRLQSVVRAYNFLRETGIFKVPTHYNARDNSIFYKHDGRIWLLRDYVKGMTFREISKAYDGTKTFDQHVSGLFKKKIRDVLYTLGGKIAEIMIRSQTDNSDMEYVKKTIKTAAGPQSRLYPLDDLENELKRIRLPENSSFIIGDLKDSNILFDGENYWLFDLESFKKSLAILDYLTSHDFIPVAEECASKNIPIRDSIIKNIRLLNQKLLDGYQERLLKEIKNNKKISEYLGYILKDFYKLPIENTGSLLRSRNGLFFLNKL